MPQESWYYIKLDIKITKNVNVWSQIWKPWKFGCGVSLGIKINPPDLNGCHLLAVGLMNNWWVWEVKIMVSNKCPIIGKQVVIIYLT